MLIDPRSTLANGIILVLFCASLSIFAFGCGGQTDDTIRADLERIDTSQVQFGPDSIATQDIKLRQTFLLGMDQQKKLRHIVKTDTSASNRFRDILARAVVAYHSDPRPVDTLVYEGRLQRNPKRLTTKKALLDMEKMQALGYAYIVTEDPEYGDVLAEYLHAWATTTVPTGNPINANKLAATIFAYDLLEERISEERRDVCREWLTSIGNALIESTPEESASLSNWHAKRIKIVGLLGVALDDARYRKYAVDEYRRYISTALNADGTSQDLEERDALDYHESALTPLVSVAIAFEGTNEGLYRFRGESGGSVANSVAFLLPFVRGDTTHAEWVESSVAFDRKRYEAGQEHYRPGRLWDPKEAIGLLELTSAYEPGHRSLVDSLQGPPGFGRYPTWETVVAEAATHR